MTVTAWLLLALCAVTALLCLLVLADDRRPGGHVPRHGRWIQDGETTRLTAPSQASARAGVLLPSERALLAHSEADDEYQFPPVPGAR